jgi:hypothetical protein
MTGEGCAPKTRPSWIRSGGSGGVEKWIKYEQGLVAAVQSNPGWAGCDPS